MSLDDDTFKLILEKTNNIKFVIGLEVLSKHYKKIIRDHCWHIEVNIRNNIVFKHIVNNYKFKKMNINILIIVLYFFVFPKKNKKESPEFEYSPISGSSYI